MQAAVILVCGLEWTGSGLGSRVIPETSLADHIKAGQRKVSIARIEHKQEAQAIMNARIVASFVFASASLGLLGCGGADCEAVGKKVTDATGEVSACATAGGDADALRKCQCAAWPDLITANKEYIDGDCYPEAFTDAQKETYKKGMTDMEKQVADSCNRQATK